MHFFHCTLVVFFLSLGKYIYIYIYIYIYSFIIKRSYIIGIVIEKNLMT